MVPTVFKSPPSSSKILSLVVNFDPFCSKDSSSFYHLCCSSRVLSDSYDVSTWVLSLHVTWCSYLLCFLFSDFHSLSTGTKSPLLLSPCSLLRWCYICHRPSSDKICRALLLIFVYWFGYSMRVLLLLFHFSCTSMGFNPCLYILRSLCPTMLLHSHSTILQHVWHILT